MFIFMLALLVATALMLFKTVSNVEDMLAPERVRA